MWIFFGPAKAPGQCNIFFIVVDFFFLLFRRSLLQKTKTRLITFFVTYKEYLLLVADL